MASIVLRSSRRYLSSSLTTNIRNSSRTVISDQKKWPILARPYSSKPVVAPVYGAPFRAVLGAIKSVTKPVFHTVGGIVTRSFNMIPNFKRKTPEECFQQYIKKFVGPAVVKVNYCLWVDNGDVVLYVRDGVFGHGEEFRSSSGISEDEVKQHIEKAKLSFEKYHNKFEELIVELELDLNEHGHRLPVETANMRDAITSFKKIMLRGDGTEDITLEIAMLKSADVTYKFGVDGGDVIFSVKNTLTGSEQQFRSPKMYASDVKKFLKEAQIHL